jgi:hypothetical protein
MSLLPGIPNPHFQAFAVGILYGLVFCTSSCLPYIASYIAGIGADFRKGVIVTLVYNVGRITAYALIGGLIGVFSGVFRFAVNESSLAPFQQYSSYAFGAVTIIIGTTILLKRALNCVPALSASSRVLCTLRDSNRQFRRGSFVRLRNRSVSNAVTRRSHGMASQQSTLIQKVALLGRRRNACSIGRSHLGEHNFFPAYVKGERLIGF